MSQPAPRPQPPLVSPFIQRLFRCTMWVFIIAVFIIMGLYNPIRVVGIDYDKHWLAARALLEGRSVYLGQTLWMGFNYPQATAFAFIWLGFFSVKAGEYVFKAFLLLLLVGCWWLAWRWYHPRRATGLDPAPDADSFSALVRGGMARRWGLTVAFLIATFYPATVCIFVGNVDPVNAILATGMVAALLAGAPLAAGILWALLTLVKMVPLVLLVPLLFWRQWRVIKGFLFVMAAYFLLLVVTGRVGQEWFFVHECMPKIPAHWRSITLAPFAAVLRLTRWAPLFYDAASFNRILFWNTLVMSSLYLLLNLVMFRRRFGLLRALEGAIVFVPLLTPLLEYHHYVWIMPVLFLQARRWVLGGMAPATALALVFSYASLDAGHHLLDLLPRGGGLWNEALHFVSLPGFLAVLCVTLADVLWGRCWRQVDGLPRDIPPEPEAGKHPGKAANPEHAVKPAASTVNTAAS